MNASSGPISMLTVHAATSLWLIRHAEVERQYQSVFGGRIDMQLSERGHRQATVLANYLHQRKFDTVYSSPMRRVQQTLAPFLVNGAPQPVILSELREVDFGDWTGLTWEQVEAKFGVSPSSWLDQLECDGIRNAECGRVFRQRLEPCLHQILSKHSGQQVAIACHGGVIRMALAILLDWPLPKLAAFEIEYASLTQIVWVGSRPKLQLVNFTPWRELLQ